MPGTLVICIGNVMRGDDGIGHRVAELLEGRLPQGVRLMAAAQLDVAFADDAAEADRVIVVDAERREEPLVEVRDVEAAPHGEFGHALQPGHLLDIAYALYASRPKMSLVTLAGPDMSHGIHLSATAEAAADEGVRIVLGLLQDSV